MNSLTDSLSGIFGVPGKQRIPQKFFPPLPREALHNPGSRGHRGVSLDDERGPQVFARTLMGEGTRSFTAHTLYSALTGRAQVRRGGAELRATLSALREAGPSDRSGHRGRGLYDTALAGGTGRSRRRRRRLPGTKSVSADFSRNRVARISKSRACALQRWPAARLAREGDLGSGKASEASRPRHHERDLSEDRGDRSRGKRRSRRFPPGPSIISAAVPLLRRPRRQGLVSTPVPPTPIAPSV